MNTPQVFSYHQNQIQTVLNEASEPWFVAVDICTALGLTDTEASLRKLDDDEKLTRKLYVSGQTREVWTVNESGLYNLIFRSTKPEAKEFRKWVTSEVLPQIRRTGGFIQDISTIRKQLEEKATNIQRDIARLTAELLRINKVLNYVERADETVFKLPAAGARRTVITKYYGRLITFEEAKEAFDKNEHIREFRGARNYRSVERWYEQFHLNTEGEKK